MPAQARPDGRSTPIRRPTTPMSAGLDASTSADVATDERAIPSMKQYW
jgi:hypothetical protein